MLKPQQQNILVLFKLNILYGEINLIMQVVVHFYIKILWTMFIHMVYEYVHSNSRKRVKLQKIYAKTKTYLMWINEQ